MHTSILKEVFFYVMSLILFFTDIFCFSFLEKQLISAVLCFFCLNLYTEISIKRVSLLTVLLSLESLLYVGKFGAQLPYLVALVFIVPYAKRLFHAHVFQPYILLVICMGIQTFFFESSLSLYTNYGLYTLSAIIANLIVLWFLSLIYTSQGNLGNHFSTF
jgi:hypothetical protein